MSIKTFLSGLRVRPRAGRKATRPVGDKKINWEFWIGNLVVVLSTVLGVYLAANAALETAIKYEAIKTDRDNYYLRTSLHNELTQNVTALEQIIENLDKGYRYRKSDAQVEHPQFFVWEALKASPSALTTPPEILSGVNSFYGNVRIILDKVSANKDFKMSMSGREIQKLLERLKAETIPALEGNLSTLKAELIEHEIPLDG
ncbi:MAG: hypothetical protein AB8G23_02830 [Myxococcota bacterium]